MGIRKEAQGQEESSKDHMDHPLPTKAQERFHDRNRVPKEEPTSTQSPTRYRRTILAEIQAKKTVKPEVRKAQRDLAIAAAKQKKKEAAASKKKASAAAKKAAPKSATVVPKNQKAAAKGAAKNFKK